MFAGKVDRLMEILAALYPECAPSIADHKELYKLTDSIPQGDIAWDSFSVQYNHALLQPNAPRLPWGQNRNMRSDSAIPSKCSKIRFAIKPSKVRSTMPQSRYITRANVTTKI
jgi:hypothetical protein